MLTADTALEVKTSGATLHYSLTNKLTNTVAVKYLEWVCLDKVLLKVDRQELSNIITRETESHLSKVVSTE